MKSLGCPHAIRGLLIRLGQKLAAARVAKGWSQEDLARRVASSRRTVISIEAGSPGAAVGTVLHIAWLLDVRVDDSPGRMVSELQVRRRVSSRRNAPKNPVDLDF
jgi:DNA-binding XRE family transcriptional regulator